AARALSGALAMIDPGKLNRRLTLEAPTENDDGAGGVTRSYAAVGKLWASVEPRSGRGAVAAGALGATASHRIVIRYDAAVTVDHRFREGGRVFLIVALRERHRRFLEIDAEARTE